MDRKAVEDKDRDVVKKFRSVVEGKEAQKKRKKGRLKLVTGLVIFCGAVFMLLLDRYPQEKPQRAIVQEITANDPLKDGNKSAALSPSESGRFDSGTPSKGNALEKQMLKNIEMAVKRPQFPKNAGDFQNVQIVVLESKKISSRASQKISTPDAVKISKIAACRDVEDKVCTSPANEFSVKKDGKVYVWMNVLSKQLPQKLRHIYFVNGRRYRTIPLSIKHPQMRTWSGISLNGYQDVGKWRVDVVSEQGQTVSHIEFRVVP